MALVLILLAACGRPAEPVPTASDRPPALVAGRGSTPTGVDPVDIPGAPVFADPPPEASAHGPSGAPSSQLDALLPTGDEVAAWSAAELIAWAGQLEGVTLPAAGTWRSLTVGLFFAADGSERLDRIETDLKVATPEAVDALVAQQVASPPRGSTVLDVIEGTDEDDGRRTVTLVLGAAGSSAASVDVVAEADGSMLHVQDLPRRDAARPDLSEERVRALVSRLTEGARPQDWQLRFARLTLVRDQPPMVMVAWSAPGQDVPRAVTAAQATFGHLTFEPVQVNQYRMTSDFEYPGAATSGMLSASTESDGTTRVELEARG
ncbi:MULTISPECIES: hypothetical protein [unclassified Actinotalea]|uniref:hypothetical protein n=1 Tax=unclassified Actinotalea TaxID=2638618 RepID=UPI0015F4A262|nr:MULTISPECIES: hypothetical protein [unclassified Actinotalea]